jgi:hypothetical protein
VSEHDVERLEDVIVPVPSGKVPSGRFVSRRVGRSRPRIEVPREITPEIVDQLRRGGAPKDLVAWAESKVPRPSRLRRLMVRLGLR